LSGHRLVDASVAGDVTGSGPSGGAANSSAPAEGHLSASDPFADRSVPAARLRAPLSRLAHAWATRDAALLASDSLGTGTAVALHLDVRDRVRRLTPAFAQGSAVTPILYDTRLLWAVDLYAASDRYPLSHRFLAAGAVRSSLRHAATALVDAQTGAVKLVRRGGADALARTWLSLLPDLVLEVGDLPAVLQARLPIPTDGALATARAFSRVGSRRTGHTARYTPDSLPGPDPFPVALGPDGSIGWSVPLVDDADQVVGMLRASGGADGGPRWQPLSAPTPRWSALSSALSRQLDSLMAAQSESRDGPLRAAAPRVLTLDGRAWLLRPAYAEEDGQWRAIGVAVASDTTAFVLPIHGGVPLRSERTRIEEAQRHYDTLRDALRQSDWLRVGAALDSLGRSLDRQP
jgi:hypothetical protein